MRDDEIGCTGDQNPSSCSYSRLVYKIIPEPGTKSSSDNILGDGRQFDFLEAHYVALVFNKEHDDGPALRGIINVANIPVQ